VTPALRFTVDGAAVGAAPGETIIAACDDAGITVTMPKRMTSGAKSEGRQVSQRPQRMLL